MKIARSTPKKARIEIIPMIDTMFFLLVFFMIATLSMNYQNSITVNLPQANSTQQNERQMHTITLTNDNQLFYNQEPVSSPAEVARRLSAVTKERQVSVTINADRRVEHGRVVELMDAIGQTGVTRVAMAVHSTAR